MRAVETLYAVDEALRIIDAYDPPDAPSSRSRRAPGSGYGCTEAPRGLLWHRYGSTTTATILDAKIVPPTSQNQATIEEDLVGFVAALARPPGRRVGAPLRADDPQLRPVHLLRDALPPVRGRARCERRRVGIGNPFRGDDAVGPVVAERLRAAGAVVLDCADEPTRLLDQWEGFRTVVVVDALRSASPGTLHRIDAGD